MNSKSGVRTRNSRFQKALNISNGEDEVITIYETSNNRSKIYQRRKDPLENTSSEATTPFKDRIKKKKINNNLTEIHVVKETGKSMKNKRENSKTAKREITFKEKGKNKSVDKITKNTLNNKKVKTIKSINLDEDDNDNDIQEIKFTSTNTNTNRVPRKNNEHHNSRNFALSKTASKTPDKSYKGKSKKKINIPKNNKKNNKKEKLPVNKNEKENEITQYELSSSEENDIKITQDKPNIDNNNNTNYIPKKTSKARKNPDINDIKSKTSIKELNSVNEDISLLNKKRKKERNVKSKTPNKLNKPKINIVNKIPFEVKDSPVKIKSGKSSSRTPVKNCTKKMKNILQAESGSNADINYNNYVSPDLALLNHLISEYGFEKVLDSLCKPKLNKEDKLDICVQGLRESSTNEKLLLFLIRMLFSYFNNKDKDKDKDKKGKIAEEKPKAKPQEKEKEKDNKISLSFLKSTSPENTNSNNELIDPSEKLISKSPIKTPNPSIINKQEINATTSMIIDENTIPPIHLMDETPKKIEKLPEKKKEGKSPIKARNEEVKKEKKNMSIGSHYHKDEDGFIYKYQVYKLDGQGNALFKCYDDKCSSEGMYDIDSRKFSVIMKHSLKYEEHDYIIGNENNEDNVFKEMYNLKKNDAQVYKEGNERSVKLY